jgi:hypothetical protein
LRRFFINKNIPPTTAAIATSPTTTPAAIPALLDPPDFAEALAVLLAVTKTVCPPITDVTMDGFEDVVAEGDEPAVLEGFSLGSVGSDEDPPLAKSTLVVVPVRYADAYVVPPPQVSEG